MRSSSAISFGVFAFHSFAIRKELPLVIADKKSDRKKISDLARVKRILSAKQLDAGADVSALERAIDELAYALYGLFVATRWLGHTTSPERRLFRTMGICPAQPCASGLVRDT